MSYCDSLRRRDFLACGTLAGTLAALGAAPLQGGTFGAAKRCVLVWLDGGPSHLETFDPKPLAPQEVRGPLSTISTRVPGIAYCETLPKLAARNDRFSVIRSMTSPVGEHNLATNYALSGHIPGGRAAAPAFLLPTAELVTPSVPLPSHIAVPNFQLGGGSKLHGFLGPDALPWSLGNGLTGIPTKGEAGEAAMRRLELRRKLLDETSAIGAELANAIDLVTSGKTRDAADISLETAQTRARYGNKPIGKHCLTARRLLEAGVPLVTVNNVGWDTHDNLADRIHNGYTGAKIPVGLAPSMDSAASALIDDLAANGMLSDTLVIVMGEFGRTPKINARGGRDHWPRAYSVLLAGAGIKHGLTFGQSDSVGENAAEDPVSPSDLVATLYHLLGIDPKARIETPDGQSMVRVPEEAQIVRSVLS